MLRYVAAAPGPLACSKATALGPKNSSTNPSLKSENVFGLKTFYRFCLFQISFLKMGQQKKSSSLELTDPVLLKEAGNEAYKKENLDEALACYTKGKLIYDEGCY